MDPLAEKYPGWSPYNYTLLNPVKLVDPDGRAPEWIEVSKNDNGTYNVENGVANSDKNVYVVDENGKRTGEVLGEMLTEYSFFSDEGTVIKDATIDLSDQSGQNFFDNEIRNIELFEYMANATGTKPLDFKHRGMSDRGLDVSEIQHHYRGMSFQNKIASARDVGNYSAGYVAGKRGFNWGASRFAFDALETSQKYNTKNPLKWRSWEIEGQPTQRAERSGYNFGQSIFRKRQTEIKWQKLKNYPIPPYSPKY